MKISLDALQILDAIDQRGSFSLAAAALHRVPSAISHAIGRLEQDLGVPLFDREGRKATLTPAGRTLLEEGRELLSSAAALECRVQRVATGWESRLVVAVDGIIPAARLFPFLHRFQEAARGTELKLTHEVLGGCWDALVAGRADLVVGAPGDMPSGTGLETHALGLSDMVFCVAPDHPLAPAPEPIPSSALRRHQVVAVADSSRILPVRSSGLLNGQPVLTVADIHTKHAAQRAGLGVGWLPRYLVQDDLQQGTLMVKAVEGAPPPAPVYLAWRQHHQGKALAWLVNALKADPAWLDGVLVRRG